MEDVLKNTDRTAANTVSVVIPAFNCQNTIGLAIKSALSQVEVAEVIVIDDASTDETLKAASAADDGSQRLKVIPLAENAGPSHARNVGIENSTSAFIAILDSDDAFLEYRIKDLLEHSDWDFIGDNIAFVEADNLDSIQINRNGKWLEHIDIDKFISRNMPRSGRPKSELAFLKPLMRRDFLKDNGLCYDTSLRLGEDYIFYLEALAKGARFKFLHRCGYVAFVRSDSLSTSFRAESIDALVSSADRISISGVLGRNTLPLANKYRDFHARRAQHRKFLDVKKKQGLWKAFLDTGSFARATEVFYKIIFDKSGIEGRMERKFFNDQGKSPVVRYLIQPED